MLIRTTATRPFESLSPSQFEAVVRQVLGRLDGVEWETMPDPIGHLGSDDGQDIRATQLARGPKRVTRREWLVQVKRYEKIHPKDLEKIVDKAIAAGSKAPYALVVAVPCDATKRSFDAFRDRAKARGVKRPELWTREKLNDALNDPKYAKTASFYFGDGSAIPGTVPLPIALDRSGGRDAPLLGREDEVEALLGATGDVLIVGPAGSGKSRLAAEIPGRRFLTLKAEANDVAESLRLDQPTHVVLDDAGLDLPRLDMLLELRQQGHEFAIIATTWAETADDVRARLPSAVRIDISLLERSEMDKTLKATGIGNYYLRGWILDLAEGRPGWAVGLADLAKGGRIPDVLSGRALIERIGPYLHRLNPAGGDKVMALIGVLAALGPLAESELGGVDAFLGIGRLERLVLLREAAAVGMVELRGGALGVAPRALRPALMAHAFFDGTSRLPIGDLLAAFPNRTAEIVMRVIEAAHAGSTAARAEVDRLLPDLSVLFNWGGLATLEGFATIDDAAAQRALRETEGLDASHEARRRVLTATTRQFLSAEAIAPLLSAAIGDSRQEHSAPDHPVRILGEIGRQVDPHGRTTFELRARVLAAANAWLEADPTTARQEIWARVVAHQLDPHVDGVYSDTGSPMTIHVAYGFESEAHIRAVGEELWPDARARLPLLQTRSLVLLSAALRELGEVKRGFPARADAVPTPDMSAAAAAVIDQMVPDLTALASTRPGLQLALHRLRRDIGVGPRQPIDPEFRLLAMGWHSHVLRDNAKHIGHAVDRLVERWLAETPTTVMARVAQWGAEAALAGTDLEPVGSTAMHRYGERVGDLDSAVQAALDAGIRSEIGSLVRRAVTRATGEPAWLPQLFAGPQRWLGLSMALDPGVDPQMAQRAATELRPDEARLAELSALRHSHDARGSVEVLHALLTHPAPEVRAAAALAFPASGAGSPSTLTPDRYTEWKAAFLDAPLACGATPAGPSRVVLSAGTAGVASSREGVRAGTPVANVVPDPAVGTVRRSVRREQRWVLDAQRAGGPASPLGHTHCSFRGIYEESRRRLSRAAIAAITAGSARSLAANRSSSGSTNSCNPRYSRTYTAASSTSATPWLTRTLTCLGGTLGADRGLRPVAGIATIYNVAGATAMTLADTSTPWAIQVSALSDRLAANLDKREYLLDVADRVLKVARDESCTTLVGASEAGRRIVEAALGRDHGMNGPIRGSLVLVVDGLLATGTNLVATADRVREEGAAGIAIVAALADRTGLQAVELEVGAKVVALEIAG